MEENKPSGNIGKVRGRFSAKEDRFIADNYLSYTDKDMAESLNREVASVINRRVKLGLKDKLAGAEGQKKDNRDAYVSSLPLSEKHEFLKKELKSSSMYRSVKEILNGKELSFYEEKYVDFMTDPSIETMTAMEKDIWHEMVMAQIRILRYMKEEKEKDTNGKTISRAREISENQKIIQDCQKSLNVERTQRLKNQSDTAINFTSIIKEMKDPGVRKRIGEEAAMLKYMGEKFYNTRLNENIISGREDKYDLSVLFKDSVEPSGLKGDFT